MAWLALLYRIRKTNEPPNGCFFSFQIISIILLSGKAKIEQKLIEYEIVSHTSKKIILTVANVANTAYIK